MMESTETNLQNVSDSHAHAARNALYLSREEIGMTNPKFESIEQYRDVESLNIYDIKLKEGLSKEEIIGILKQKSRDNSRTPMQWNEEMNSGFTTSTPWISAAENFKEINVEKALEDKESVFYHYKKLIELRKTYDVIIEGEYAILDKMILRFGHILVLQKVKCCLL